MNRSPRWLNGLKWLLLANVAASVLHYADNLLFFAQYPEPLWINRSIVDAFWFFMTPLAWLGYWLMQRGHERSGTLVVLGYGACNLLSLGHYRYASICNVAARINAFIMLEAALAGVLMGYVVVFCFRKPTSSFSGDMGK